MVEQFEVLVIGGGGAGYTAASTAARLGKRVAMAERGKLGGTCLHVGCVPSKTLLRAAHVAETVRRAGDFGIEVDGWRLHYPRVVGRARDIVQGFSGAGPRESLTRQEITLLEGAVRFLGPHTVECAGQRYEAERFVIASGSSPLVPELPGLHDVAYLTSNEALWLESLPASVVIVGGSIVGCEFASLWAAFGVEVTIVARSLMPQEDPEVGTTLLAAFEARGIHLVRGRVVGLARAAGRRAVQVVRVDGTETAVLAEAVLMATGRQAQFHDLQLDAAGVQTWERGIAVDATMRTSASHIWAAGDVTGRHMYTHAGDDAAAVAGWNAAAGEPEREVDWRVVPRPVYAIPETASIGLLESEARAQGLTVDVARVCYRDIARAVIQGETEGFAKIIAERASGQILGAAIVGAQACELIGEIAVAMAGRVSAWRVGDTQHPYPTLSELVRWTADQVGKASRSAAEQAPGVPVAAPHQQSLSSWPTEGSKERSAAHCRA